MLFQVSFFGVPNTSKSYSAVSSETVSVEISSGVIVDIARQMISEVRGDEKLKKVVEKIKPKSKK